ncbi:MAG: hypothetical protein LBE25_14790 [Arthrobacter sp.]|jgi:hypothetical protein|nr:hypothetical protein [Arthrobacter sp.]
MRINPSWRLTWVGQDHLRVGSGPGAVDVRHIGPELREWLGRLAWSGAGVSESDLASAPPGAKEAIEALAAALVEEETPSRALAGVPGLAGDRLRGDALAWASAYGQGVGAALSRRHRAHVWISGLDRCGLNFALALAAAGVGRLSARDRGKLEPGDLGGGPLRLTELGLPRPAALARHLGRLYPHTQLLAPIALHDAVRGVDLAVLVCRDGLAARDAGRLVAAGVATLPIVFHESGFVIGPLHLPDAPGCPRCRWEAWPLVDQGQENPDAAAPAPPETTSALLAAALAAQAVVMAIDDINLPSLTAGRYVGTLGAAALHFEPLPNGCQHRLAA